MDIKVLKEIEYILKEKFNVKLEEVAGQEKAKEALKEYIINTIKFQKQSESKQNPLIKYILLYSPPSVVKHI